MSLNNNYSKLLQINIVIKDILKDDNRIAFVFIEIKKKDIVKILRSENNFM